VSGWKEHFGRFLGAAPGRLHAAAHSHHPWPDVSFQAHQQAWLDAAELADDKWEKIFGEVIPEAQGHVAGRLGLADPATVAFAPSTHELLMRLLSCLPQNLRVLTTDAEFHSFARQMRRLEEEGLAEVERVAAEPFDSFPARLAEGVAGGSHDLVYFSQVHFNSGYVVPDLKAVVAAVPEAESFLVVDGYHGFMALPTDLAAVEGRAFYLGGGYKYAMAGEGAAFMHCPPGHGARPVDTGWFAGFGDLSAPPRPGDVAYPADGLRFLGATLDPAPLYRFNAVQRWVDDVGLSVEAIHDHVAALQARLLEGLDGNWRKALLPPEGTGERGHFLTFRLPDAGAVYRRLHAARVITDHRDDRLRIGFGIYHDEADVDDLARHLQAALVSRG
jgi:selenocysteine lyase/cysteine desulfurase